jgi:hypothetical protein
MSKSVIDIENKIRMMEINRELRSFLKKYSDIESGIASSEVIVEDKMKWLCSKLMSIMTTANLALGGLLNKMEH